MSLASILFRLALTGLLATIATIVGSEWKGYRSQYGTEAMQDFGVIVALASLAGLACIVWAYRTKGLGLAVRLTLSVPLMAGIVFVMVWVGPPYERMRFIVFTGTVVLTLASLFIALWAYWPEKKKD